MGAEDKLVPALLAALRDEPHDDPGKHFVPGQMPGVGGRSGNIPKLSAAHDYVVGRTLDGSLFDAYNWWSQYLATEDMMAGEDGSRIYAGWHVIPMAVARWEARQRGDLILASACRRWLRSYFAFAALGASPWPSWRDELGTPWVGYASTMCGNRSFSGKHGGPLPNDELWRHPNDMMLHAALTDTLPTVTGWEADCVRAMGQGWHGLDRGEQAVLAAIVDTGEELEFDGTVEGWLSQFRPRASTFRLLRWANGQCCTICLSPTNRNTDPIYALLSNPDGGMKWLLGRHAGGRDFDGFDNVDIDPQYEAVFAGTDMLRLPDAELVYDLEYGPQGAKLIYPAEDEMPDTQPPAPPAPDDDELDDQPPARNVAATLKNAQAHLSRIEDELSFDDPNLNIVSNNLGRAQVLVDQAIQGL